MLSRIFFVLGVSSLLLIVDRPTSLALDSYNPNFGELIVVSKPIIKEVPASKSRSSRFDSGNSYLDRSEENSNINKQFDETNLFAQVEGPKIIGIEKDSSESLKKPNELKIKKQKPAEEEISPEASFLNADFFADSLSEAYTLEDDPMGEQRLLQVRNSSLAPSVAFSSSYNYSSNPEKVANPTKKDGTTLNLSITFNLGLGEYGLGDEVVCAPAFSFAQMRTFTDPFRDHGKSMQVYDLDTQIASLSLPFVLPNDFSLTLSNAYVVPSTFRGKKNIISYSNTPSLSFSKNFILNSGDVINFTAGATYTFSQGDTLEQQISDPVYYNFIEAVMQQSGISTSSEYPSNLQDGFGHALSISYSKMLSESLTLVPSLSYQSNSFTKGANSSRVDKVYNVGLSASNAITEWLNISGLVNYSWKRTNDDLNTPEFEDFVGGLSININHSF